MANIGRGCTMKIADARIPEQNCPPNPILPPDSAVDFAITDVLGLTKLNAAQRRAVTRREGHLCSKYR